MGSEPRFRPDLYAGTASYYDRFRLPYTAALLDHLRGRVPLSRTSRVVDLACGTGQIAFALAGHVAEVLAVDQEPEAVHLGARKAARVGVDNIHWIVAAAEHVVLDGPFDLVAIGNAFHRLDRELVARRMVPYLAERGCIALLWSDPPWHGDAPWQRALDTVLEHWMDELDARDRVPADWESEMECDPHEHVLQRAGLVDDGEYSCTQMEHWTIDALIGFVYSTSFLGRSVVGGRADEFEADVRARLAGAVLDQDVTYAYQLARRPV